MLPFLFAFFILTLFNLWRVWVALHFPVNRILLLYHTLGNSNALPLGSSVVHSVHQLSVLSNVFRICVTTVPVWESCLLSNSTFPWYQFAISQDVSASILNAVAGIWVNHLFCGLRFFYRFVVISNLHVSVQVHVNHSISFTLQLLVQQSYMFHLFVKQTLKFFVFFSFDIRNLLKSVPNVILLVILVNLFEPFQAFHDFFR